MKHTNIIFFIGGAVIGALGGFFGAKAHYEKVYREYAEETVNEMKEILYGMPKDEEPYEAEEEDDEPVMVNTWTKEREEEIRQRLERNRKGTNYAAMYGNIKTDIGGTQHEETDSKDAEDPEDDDSETEDPELAEIISRHEASKGRKPHLISADKAAELPPGIDMVELQFYDEDNVLADVDTEERISYNEIETLLGDCLTKYNFVDSDEPVIYVMNEELDVCYEIVRVRASYSETHD